jgi:hypothetical protein
MIAADASLPIGGDKGPRGMDVTSRPPVQFCQETVSSSVTTGHRGGPRHQLSQRAVGHPNGIENRTVAECPT